MLHEERANFNAGKRCPWPSANNLSCNSKGGKLWTTDGMDAKSTLLG